MKKNIIKLTSIFKALSDENRLKIIHLVYKKNLRCKLDKCGQCEDLACMKFLAKHLKIGFPTISHHVKELKNAGIIIIKKEGRWSYLQINPESLGEIALFAKTFGGKAPKRSLFSFKLSSDLTLNP